MITPHDLPPPVSEFTEEQAAKLCAYLFDSIACENAAKALSDAQLADRFLNEVWGIERLTMESEAIVSELLSRFEAKCGIRRDAETGEVVREETI